MFGPLLTGLRTLAGRTDWLRETCTIQRGASSRTSAGTKVTWSTLASNVPCAVQPGGGASETEGARGGITAQGDWRIRLPYGQAVTEKDRIIVGARTFEVENVLARTFEVVRIAECVEIK